MSKGEIVNYMGEGKYRIRQKLAYDRIQAELNRLNARIAELAIDVPNAKADLSIANSAVSAKAEEIDLLIPDLQSGVEGARKAIVELQKQLISLQAEARKIEIKVAELVAENLSALKRRGQLEAVPEDRELEAWCADYTEDLAGEVGLVDVNDEGGIVPIVQPGFEDNAVYQPARDGALFPNLAQSAAQIYFNAAVMPGVQKWRPGYRVGEIVSIDGDTCTVNLDNAKSSIQALEINQSNTLTDIPIQYMECNADAFEVGDRALVRYFAGGPQVVGFANNPRQCSVDMLWKSLQRESASNQYDIQRRTKIGRNDPAISAVASGGDAVCLYDDVEWYHANGAIYSGNTFVVSTPSSWNGATNDLRIFDNAVSGAKEVWVSGLDSDDNGYIAKYTESGQFIGTIFLGSGADVSGYIFMSASPHYYVFAASTGITVRKIASGDTVMLGHWCLGNPHTQSGLVDITDELVVWGCKDSVVCRTLPDGSSLSVPVDYQYLEFTVTSLRFDFTRGIVAVQLTSTTLTVFGSTRYIHYRVTRNENGKPNGFAEISRYQYADHENYNVYVSSDRSKIRAIPPA